MGQWFASAVQLRCLVRGALISIALPGWLSAAWRRLTVMRQRRQLGAFIIDRAGRARCWSGRHPDGGWIVRKLNPIDSAAVQHERAAVHHRAQRAAAFVCVLLPRRFHRRAFFSGWRGGAPTTGRAIRSSHRRCSSSSTARDPLSRSRARPRALAVPLVLRDRIFSVLYVPGHLPLLEAPVGMVSSILSVTSWSASTSSASPRRWRCSASPRSTVRRACAADRRPRRDLRVPRLRLRAERRDRSGGRSHARRCAGRSADHRTRRAGARDGGGTAAAADQPAAGLVGRGTQRLLAGRARRIRLMTILQRLRPSAARFRRRPDLIQGSAGERWR